MNMKSSEGHKHHFSTLLCCTVTAVFRNKQQVANMFNMSIKMD